MPRFIVTDGRTFDQPTACALRRSDNVKCIQYLARHEAFTVDVINEEVLAENAKWSFTQRPEAPYTIKFIDTSVRLVLIEHVWPMDWHPRVRAEFGARLMKSLVAQFTNAVIVMVARTHGENNSQYVLRELNLRKRKVFCRPVEAHYTPLQMQEDGKVPVMINGPSEAVVVMPHAPVDIWLHCYFLPLIKDAEAVHMPRLCKAMLSAGWSVLQLACYSCESTVEIMRVCSGECEDPDWAGVETCWDDV